MARNFIYFNSTHSILFFNCFEVFIGVEFFLIREINKYRQANTYFLGHFYYAWIKMTWKTNREALNSILGEKI